MISAVTSSSAALTILKTEVWPQTAHAQQEHDSLRQSLDPRSIYQLPAQSLDGLLQVRAQLRRDQVLEPQAQQGVVSNSSKGTPGQSSMLGWMNKGTPVHFSYLDDWNEQMKSLKARSTEPLNSSLMPWNSPDVIQQLKDMDAHAIHSDARERELRASDEAIYKSMAETPTEDVVQIKALGGEIWYERSQTYDQISDKEFFRNIKNQVLYGPELTDPIDPSNQTAHALLNGTAQIIRASKFQELQYKSTEYITYALDNRDNKYKWIGGLSNSDYNQAYLHDLEKKSPGMEVSYIIWAHGDAAFILSPKTTSATSASTAVGRRNATETGTKPTSIAAP
ncbi:hypothetical protein [Methylobacterium brachiatum]|uniref:hypothetical protein n=1 Tax=Methylobacterium brachiatum TaxID=269660 RepID=UPI0008E4F864|nr:hypothetical protein [Methylobacterium brachiatum]SFJ50335.1 hypothetical protein SAMN02799642_04622 [Methylobacterium brachiatum]